MNIPLTLNTEYQNALDGMLARYNESASVTLTEPEYLAAVLNGAIGVEVKALFDAEVARIGASAASLSYEARQALIVQIEAQINS
jgi:hypothetical protein